VPRAAVVHRTYATKGEVKPQQAYGAVFAGLALRTRYGNFMHFAQGFAMLATEILAPESFPGRSWGMVRTGLRYLRNLPRFLGTRVRPGAAFHPYFNGWSYEERRDGAFVEMHSRRGPHTRRLPARLDPDPHRRQRRRGCARRSPPAPARPIPTSRSS
jgi:hypothetical protein